LAGVDGIREAPDAGPRCGEKLMKIKAKVVVALGAGVVE
jgi:hypothetical protein